MGPENIVLREIIEAGKAEHHVITSVGCHSKLLHTNCSVGVVIGKGLGGGERRGTNI